MGIQLESSGGIPTMSRVFISLIATLGALPLIGAEEVVFPLTAQPAPVAEPAPAPAPKVAPKPFKETPFTPFTGRIKGRKVRLRLQPDLESHIVKELGKHELVSVIGETGDFWAVEPPSGTKAYVFRSFVLENTVEGNRVNIRLEPDLEAPVIGHFNAGDKVNGTVSARNSKWLEITPPSHTQFYIAKELVEYAGTPEFKAHMEKRKSTVEQLLDAAALLSKVELRKTFEEVDIERLTHSYKTVIHDFADFPEYVEQAREALATLQEQYTEKKIAFLEAKANSVLAEETLPLLASSAQEEAEPAPTEPTSLTDKMKLWEPVEEALYLTWARLNEDRSMEDFYDEQKLSSIVLSGILEAYNAPVKNKPGDYVLKERDLPVAYLYSSQLNLQHLIGKRVTVTGSPRPNNNFAFPAYFVLSAE
jgi:hypothetical protein